MNVSGTYVLMNVQYVCTYIYMYSICLGREIVSTKQLTGTTYIICMYVQYVFCRGLQVWLSDVRIQRNLSIKVTLDEGHLSNEGTVCSPNYVELCTKLRTSELVNCSVQDSQPGPYGVQY